MKRVMQIKLTPDAKQSEALNATMQRFNDACNWVAERAFERQLANRFKLHKLYYYDVRSTFDLPANFACAVFARVAAVLRRDKRVKPSFKPRASLPYDARLLRFLNLHEVSLTHTRRPYPCRHGHGRVPGRVVRARQDRRRSWSSGMAPTT